MKRRMIPMDGNTAASYVAHATNEVIAIYPITPSSPMGELADERSAKGIPNIWGTIPSVSELQSEGGAAGAVHGALTTGALVTTFTASQGLLLMVPNMFKIAGELCPTVFHVSARSVACQALSIFGDHSDVMAVRSTGFGLICSGNVQEVMDLALIAQGASLESRVPFVHFFDGFRTSHEIQKVEELTFEDMHALIDERFIQAHRARGMTPDRPVLRGTAQNPDVFFAARETVNKYYLAVPEIVERTMDKFAGITGRQYHPFDYVGAPDAERIILIMGSAAETTHETVEYLCGKGKRVGMIKVRLYRPFSVEHLAGILPETVKKIAVMDRTKEPGALGEPLYTDICSAVYEMMEKGIAPFSSQPTIVGGRYGLGSKEYTPPMVKAIFDNLASKKPKNHFTVGITDDVTHTSLEVHPSFSLDQRGVFQAMFYGLGADGTVGANKNSIKIIGENTDNQAQGYFVYDSRKAGAITTSHLRFGMDFIRSPYLIEKANFVACHHFAFLERYDILEKAEEGAIFLLNSPYSKDEVWDKIPREVQEQIIKKKIQFYVVDAIRLGQELGLGARINMIMQTAFFAISKIMAQEEAVKEIKGAIKKTYGGKGEEVVDMNLRAVDAALKSIEKVGYPMEATSEIRMPPVVPPEAPEFVQKVTARIMAGKGDDLPVSLLPDDGTYPTGTTQWEKRNIATQIPEWDAEVCIQCGMCSLVCPHAAIRIKVYDPSYLRDAPAAFPSIDAKGKDFSGMKFTVQVAPEDCTSCGVCVWKCPARKKDAEGKKTDERAINMVPQFERRHEEAKNYAFFLNIPDTDPALFKRETVKGSQLIRPLFEYSGACAGCGETAYVKLLSQLSGDHLLIGNATGCSSIYGGNLPTTPYTVRPDGRGPTWSNSLFEDNAEFGFGMRLTLNKFREIALELLDKASAGCKALEGREELVEAIKNADQRDQAGLEEQRARLEDLKKSIAMCKCESCERLLTVADYLVRKAVWVLGGDGWAYDIGFGGLDHVLASGLDVNMLVLDTEVYSNTGGQMSKSTPRAATAKFAYAGKPMPKKDLALIAVTYGTIYVARVALGANPAQTVKAFIEAEQYDGPSLIIAYAHCIAHGIDMTAGLDEQKKAVECGYWPLFRFSPDRAARGENPLILDSKPPSADFREYALGENRYRVLQSMDRKRAEELIVLAEKDTRRRYKMYEKLVPLYEELVKE